MAFDKTRAAAVAAKWGPLVFVVIAIGTLLATWFTSYVRDRPISSAYWVSVLGQHTLVGA